MTYKQLLQQLRNMPIERLNDDVAIYDRLGDEFFKIVSARLRFAGEGDEADGILDEGQPYLVVDIGVGKDKKDDSEESEDEE